MPTVKELINEYGRRLVGGKIWFRCEPRIIEYVDLDELFIRSKPECAHMDGTWTHYRCARFTDVQLSDLHPTPGETVKELIETHGRSLIGYDVKWADRGTYEITDIGSDKIYALSKIGRVAMQFDSGTILEFSDLVPPKRYHRPETKTPFELLDFGFAGAMCENWQAGVKAGRVADDWQFLPGTDEVKARYAAKIMRHLQAYIEGEGGHHAVAIACNANILWHIEGRGE
jgi:hypothetical protein